MSDIIRLLPDSVANQIAAGEVIQRPASVIKELVENSIDAGATSVTIILKDAGRTLIQVIDDGCGMSDTDARLAFERHATSKISRADDLFSLSTMGFRGEALASIAAIAQVDLRTMLKGESVGTRLTISGSKVESQKPEACAPGSNLMVKNLFFNVPARRKFLKKDSVELSNIMREFERLALVNIGVDFTLISNDTTLHALRRASLKQRIADLFGKSLGKQIIPVETDTSIVRINGFIGLPENARKRNPLQYFMVNGRNMRHPYFHKAIMQCYERLIPADEQPNYFINLTVDPETIDVNIHPHKTEIHFADEQAVWQIINASVRETLAKTGAVPMMDFDRKDTVEIPVLQRGAVYDEPAALSNADYNPFREEYIDPTAAEPDVAFTGFDVPFTDEDAAKTAAMAPKPVARETTARHNSRSHTPAIEPNTDFEVFASAADDFEEFPSVAATPVRPRAKQTSFHAPAFDPISDRSFTEAATGTQLETEDDTTSQLEFLPSAAPEQQQLELEDDIRFGAVLPLNGGYAATTLNGRLVIVDLRRARERIRYEDYLRMLHSGTAVSEQLLFPETLTLSLDEYALLEEHAVEFAALGFDLAFCGNETVEVKGTPADLPTDAVDRLIYELLQTFASPVSLEEVRRDKIATLLARAGSRTALRTSTPEEAADLLERLAATGNYSFSPSGKAILTEIAPEEIKNRLG